jgi:hypothetical protein
VPEIRRQVRGLLVFSFSLLPNSYSQHFPTSQFPTRKKPTAQIRCRGYPLYIYNVKFRPCTLSVPKYRIKCVFIMKKCAAHGAGEKAKPL